jgi:phosphopantothenate---cysteine ligase (ATP)
MLGEIKKTWNPKAFCVSFKLETDLSILETKVLKAIEAYGVDMVVANQL